MDRSIIATFGDNIKGSKQRAEHDYYATPPESIDELLSVENFNGDIWEPACGEGHLSKRLIELGKNVKSTDLIDRGYDKGSIDFLKCNDKNLNINIITNPPFNQSIEFMLKALDIIADGYKVALFLKLLFVEGQKRYKVFQQFPPKNIYVYSRRRECGRNGKFIGSCGICYAWFIWEKGTKTDTILKWIY